MNQYLDFQYSLLHYRHDLITGEFLNVGLAMYSSSSAFFKVRLLTKIKRITSTFPGADGDFYRKYIHYLQLSFDQIKINPRQGQLSLLEEPQKLEEIINRVLPYDDSSLYFGETKYGMAENLEEIFEQLYARQVEYYLADLEKTTRGDDEVWTVYRAQLAQHNVLARLKPIEIQTPIDVIPFAHAWRNGKVKALEAISFDLAIPTTIRKKAREWRGTTAILDESRELSTLYLLLGKPGSDRTDLKKAYDDSKSILTRQPPSNYKVEIIEEDGAEDFGRYVAPIIEKDLQYKEEQKQN